MPYELYWRGPLNAFLIYAEKARLEFEKENRVAWLHGAYITRAISSAFDGKSHPYPQNPIASPTPKQKEMQQQTEDAITEHNAQMRAIREQSAIKLQRQLETKEANSHVGTNN